MLKQNDGPKAAEARARRAAARSGLRALKSRRALSGDNWGGFMLMDLRNCIVAGVRFELSPEDVIAYCIA